MTEQRPKANAELLRRFTSPRRRAIFVSPKGKDMRTTAFKAVGWMRARDSTKKCQRCLNPIRIQFQALILVAKDPFVGDYRVPLCEECGRDFEKENE